MQENLKRLNAEEAFARCKQLWTTSIAEDIIKQFFEEEYASFDKSVIVLDDDPTGVQTVHDIDVVTSWDVDTISEMLSEEKKLFFVLANSRSFSAERTKAVYREIAKNAVQAAKAAGKEIMLISRGDSTLRGHFPLETQTLREIIEEDKDLRFDGEILCPFFREGGRFTIDGVHYVREGDELVPAAQTEFAKDKTFGYNHSRLPEYIEEKSGGLVHAEQVLTVTLSQLRSLKLSAIEEKLAAAEGFRYIVVDAIDEVDVQAMAVVLMRLMKRGKRYLFRSAAAVPKVFGAVEDRPLLSRSEMESGPREHGGLVIVGSHVKKTTAQLECLRESETPLEFIEFNVGSWDIPGGLESETRRVAALAENAICSGKTAVVYTTRTLVAPQNASAEEMLAISVRISDAVTNIVSSLNVRPRFLIAKGGITSSDIGTKALRVKRARVLGQAQPGVPVWQTGEESLFPGLSYIIFPGNVGSTDTLRTIVELLA
ncbi:MAG: hydroxyacid dehydrogenase [Clostridia bacterium]|nr:hydroxyacid dehydrogenase [Clostridia bacterium]